jgi:hypothetical protein
MAPSRSTPCRQRSTLAGTVYAGEAPGRCFWEVAGAAVPRTSRISALCCRTCAISVSGSGAGAESRRCPPRTRILPPARRTASIRGAAVMAPMPPPSCQHGARWSVSNAAWSVSDQATTRIRLHFQGAGQFGQFGQFLGQEVPGLRESRARSDPGLVRRRSDGSYLELPAHGIAQFAFCRTPCFIFCPN